MPPRPRRAAAAAPIIFEKDNEWPERIDDDDGESSGSFHGSEPDTEGAAAGAATSANAAPASVPGNVNTTVWSAMYELPELPETIHLKPTTRPGPSLNLKLWFGSEGWINALRADVDDLVQAVTGAWQQNRVETEVYDGDRYRFDVFKQRWVDKGWSRLLVLGFVEGLMRREWCLSVARAFLDCVAPAERIERQIVGLYALYTLWMSQTSTMDRFHIPADQSLLERLVNLPFSAPNAEPNERSAPSHPSLSLKSQSKQNQNFEDRACCLDVAYIVSSLIKSNAFFIVPSEAMLRPRHLPNVHLRSTTIANLDLAAQTVLAIQKEVYALERGQLSLEQWNDGKNRRTIECLREPVTAIKEKIKTLIPLVYSKTLMAGLDADSTDTQQASEPEWSDRRNWNGRLQQKLDDYVTARDEWVHELVQSDLGTVLTGDGVSKRVGDDVLDQAQDRTRSIIKDAVVGLNDDANVGLIEQLYDVAGETNGKRRKMDLIHLVDKDNKNVAAYKGQMSAWPSMANDDTGGIASVIPVDQTA
ncbi:hypothetical protein OIO90_003589 [Microbotryomycetes sp. JL221]|nr:hypothetical protein OIO90_003589 [Microbotryomycetes sp. JL221]